MTDGGGETRPTRALVVEDEAMVARRLIRLLGKILGPGARLEHRRTFEAARAYLERHPIDLLFLDLDLEGLDGFDLLTEATAGSFDTVVVSARHDRALEAFEHGVADFVPKPYSEERLARAVSRTRPAAGRRQRLRYLSVRVGSRLRSVPIDRIVFLQGADDYVELHCDDGETHLHAKTLTALEALLPSPFVRVHRSFIVRLDRVEALESAPGSRYRLILHDGREVPVSRGRVQALRETLGR